MKRTAMELAALASAAMPGLDIVQATVSPDDRRAFDSAIVTDTDNNHWRVRSPHNSQAAFRLETEIQVLSGFSPAIRAHLPFRVPSVAGAVQIDALRTFIYHQMPGAPVDLDTIMLASPQTIDDIGRIIAAIHQLPVTVVESADLPAYGAEQTRTRLLAELDQMALTGKISSDLLRRWENAFEERQMWHFIPRVVHGDFDETSLLVDRDRALGVTGWTDLHLGDPAQDFMWLASTDSLEFREAVLSAYHRHMDVASDRLDLHIMRRAALAAEFSLAKYLMTGLQAGDDQIVDEAQAMLVGLAADIAQTGGQDIGQRYWETPTVDDAPQAEPHTPAYEPDASDVEDPVEDAAPSATLSAVHEGADDEPIDAATDTGPDDVEDAEAVAVDNVDAADAAPVDEVVDATSAEVTDEPVRDEHRAELVVHTVSDDGELVPHEPVEDEDTQPISWTKVNERLNKN